MTQEIEFIFVYGTLCRTARTRMSQLLNYHSEYIGEAVMQGQLYQVDTYSGAIESSDATDNISGELYKMVNKTTLLPLLDQYEECSEEFPEPHEYVRKVLPITLNTGEIIEAWVYVYNRDVSTLRRIA